MRRSVSNSPTVPDDPPPDTSTPRHFYSTWPTIINIQHLATMTTIVCANPARAEPLLSEEPRLSQANKPWYRQHSRSKGRY